MLDPRIYRTGLVVVALAVIVFAFSFQGGPGSLGTTLSPGAFNSENAYTAMTTLSQRYPRRRPGSAADAQIADYVARTLSSEGFGVSSDTFGAQTVDGPRTLRNVVGVRAGTSNGTVVVVAHRDSIATGAPAELSGTAVLLELGRVLAGETQTRSIMLVSTSGSAGAAGVAELVRKLPGQINAVIALGDLAGTKTRGSIVVPWSNGRLVAPAVLRNTAAAALTAQAGLGVQRNSLSSQFLHLALPMAATEQAPFISHGVPAVLVSVSGESSAGANEQTSQARIDALGRSVLATVNALSAGPQLPAPSSYMLFSGQAIPGWAVRLLVLGLILPVVAATVDGLARARRRGHAILPWVLWVLAAGLPFALATLLARALRLVGVIDAAPPGPLAGDAVALHGRATVILVGLTLLVVLGLFGLRPLVLRLARSRSVGAFLDIGGPGAAAGLLVVLCAVSLALWAVNPFAALMLVPALHLWLWGAGSQRRLARGLLVAVVIAGIAAPALAAVDYLSGLGLDIPQAGWSAVLLIASGGMPLSAALEWSVALGCAASMTLIAARAMRQPRPEPTPVTVRGPVTYAGPGSLGGTGSAVRR